MDAPTLKRFVGSLIDPASYAHLARMVHYWHYSHVGPRRRIRFGTGVRLPPTVSFRNGERISIGDRTSVGDGSFLWAGDSTGRIDIGADCMLGPHVFITASDYSMAPGVVMSSQQKAELDISVGDDVWIGTLAVITSGVTIGDGAVIGAGAVVTNDIAANSIAVGVPARQVRTRDEHPNELA